MSPASCDLAAQQLLSMPGVVSALEVELLKGTRPGGPSSGRPVSRPPVLLDVVSDIEESWNELGGWVLLWRVRHGLAGSAAHWHARCSWLANHLMNTAARDDDVESFCACVNDCHRRLSRWLHDAPRAWLPIPGRWRCPVDECGGLLLQRVGEPLIRCPVCGAAWKEHEYEWLGQLLGCDYRVTISQAARWARVHPRTIQRWIALGRLPTQMVGNRVVLDRRDLVAWQLRHAGGE